METKNIKFSTITLTLITFIISLTKDAAITKKLVSYDTDLSTNTSFDFFSTGPLAIFTGDIIYTLIWVANPLCIIAMIQLLQNKITAKKISLIALILSLCFIFCKKMMLDPMNGNNSEIITLKSGYYLWVLSIIILNLGIRLNFSVLKREKKETV